MRTTRGMRAALVGAFLLTMAGAAVELGAQGDKYSARLSWVPTAGAERVSGKGIGAAALSGRALTITGSFEGLGGPATVARLHEGIAKGARGRAVTDLTITKATSGTFSGVVDADPRAGRVAPARQALHADPRRQGPRARWREPLGVAAAMTRDSSLSRAHCMRLASLALVRPGRRRPPRRSRPSRPPPDAPPTRPPARAAMARPWPGRRRSPGTAFAAGWGSRTTRDLLTAIQSMPPEQPGGLPEATYLAITAYILQTNGASGGPAGAHHATTVPIGAIFRAGPPRRRGAGAIRLLRPRRRARGAAPGGRRGARTGPTRGAQCWG